MVTVGSLVSGLITLLIVTIGWSDFGAGGGVGLQQFTHSKLLFMICPITCLAGLGKDCPEAVGILGGRQGRSGILGAADTFRHPAAVAADTCRLAVDNQGNMVGVVAGCSGKVLCSPRSLVLTHWLDQSWVQMSQSPNTDTL